MLKKLFTFFIIIIISFYNSCLANEVDNEEIPLEYLEVSSNINALPDIISKYAIVLDRPTKTVLFEKNGYSKTAMASTTKIMTAIIAIENTNLSDKILISKKAANTGGSTLGISANSTLTMETVLYGLLLRSGNDCAVAIAEHISGNIENFSILMNEKAKEIGLKNTNFVTPHGLDAQNHYTTAYDLALLTNYALNNQTFCNFVSKKTATIYMENSTREIHNTHELIGNIQGVYGVKTGFTGNAGRCLVTACKRNNLDIIVIILGANTKKERTQDTLNLINHIYNNYELVDTSKFLHQNFSEYNLKIKNSLDKAKVAIKEKDNYIYPIPKNDINNLKCKTFILENQKAPIIPNSKIGTIKVFVNNKILYETDIIIKNEISSLSTGQYFFLIIKSIFRNKSYI